MSIRIAILLVAAVAGSSAAQEARAQTPAASRAGDSSGPEWTFGWEEHPTLRLRNEVRLDFRARFQGDVRGGESTLAPATDIGGFDLARRRIGVAGSVGRDASFQVEYELANNAPWRDVYIDYRLVKAVQVQAGKFKLPFGLDENTSSSQLDFLYRSRAATELAPGRDRGVMAHGRIHMLRYELGVFAHDGDNARGANSMRAFGNRTTAGRLVYQPFRSSKSPFEDLQVGAAFTTSDVPAGVSDLSGRTAIGQQFFPKRYFVNGARTRVGLEGRWRPGPLSFQGEYTRLTSERLGQSVEGTDLAPLVGRGWYGSAAWVLTGERKRRGATEPAHPLFDGGAGSIELAARVEELRYSSRGVDVPSTAPRAETIALSRDRAVTLGVNWAPNRWTRVQFNLIRDAVSSPVDPSRFPASSWGRVVRFQVSL